MRWQAHVDRVTPLRCACSEYVAVTEAFCERGQDWQAGLVCQGLTEALGNILQSWRAVVTKLHTFRPQQRFTLLVSALVNSGMCLSCPAVPGWSIADQ